MTYPEFKQMIEENTDATVSEMVGGVATVSRPVKMLVWDDNSDTRCPCLIVAITGMQVLDDDGSVWNHMAPIPQRKKRYRTSKEIAGKWLHHPNGCMIHAAQFDEDGDVLVAGRADNFADRFLSVEEMHKKGVRLSDTPTSEPYSLETDQ